MFEYRNKMGRINSNPIPERETLTNVDYQSMFGWVTWGTLSPKYKVTWKTILDFCHKSTSRLKTRVKLWLTWYIDERKWWNFSFTLPIGLGKRRVSIGFISLPSEVSVVSHKRETRDRHKFGVPTMITDPKWEIYSTTIQILFRVRDTDLPLFFSKLRNLQRNT